MIKIQSDFDAVWCVWIGMSCQIDDILNSVFWTSCRLQVDLEQCNSTTAQFSHIAKKKPSLGDGHTIDFFSQFNCFSCHSHSHSFVSLTKSKKNYFASMPSNTGNYVEKIPKQRGRCTSCLCMSWRVFMCITSHVMLITMVVAYCLMGSYLFEWLEAENERNVCHLWTKTWLILTKIKTERFFFNLKWPIRSNYSC